MSANDAHIKCQAIPVGFDPLKLLRRMVSGTGEEVFRLELPYKKLWFRKAHPNGRIYVKPLQLSEKIAIYEAQVFLNREDNVPFCSFTASVASKSTPDGSYVEKAQAEAVDNALADAGFGIQIADRYYGSEVPVSAYLGTAPKAIRTSVKKPLSVAEKTVVQPPMVAEQTAPASQVETVVSTARTEPKTEPVIVCNLATEPAAAQIPLQAVFAPEAESVSCQEIPAANAALELLRVGKTLPQVDDGDLPFTMGPAYTNDMTIEQIVGIMTLEQAKAVVVDDGMSKGMTMGEVAEKRPASLQFYLSVGYRKNNNILKAAAQILFNERQKAS